MFKYARTLFQSFLAARRLEEIAKLAFRPHLMHDTDIMLNIP